MNVMSNQQYQVWAENWDTDLQKTLNDRPHFLLPEIERKTLKVKSEGSLSCCTCCDKRQGFIVISKERSYSVDYFKVSFLIWVPKDF